MMSLPKLYILVVVIFIMAVAASCGQTGDLFLPGDDPKQKSKDKSEN